MTLTLAPSVGQGRALGPDSRPVLLGFDAESTPRMAVELDAPNSPWLPLRGQGFHASSVVLATDGRLYVGSRMGRLHVIQP